MEGFLRYRFGRLIFEGAYTWRGLFSEFYGMIFEANKEFVENLSLQIFAILASSTIFLLVSLKYNLSHAYILL